MTTDDRTVTFWFAVGLFLALLGLALTTGCASFSALDFQRGISTAAEVVDDLDHEIAPLVEGAVQRCDAEHADREGFLACIEPYVPLDWGIRSLRNTLLGAQATFDAVLTGERDGAEAWLPIGACIAYALTMISNVVALADWDVSVSEALGWVDVFGRIAETQCPQVDVRAPVTP